MITVDSVAAAKTAKTGRLWITGASIIIPGKVSGKFLEKVKKIHALTEEKSDLPDHFFEEVDTGNYQNFLWNLLRASQKSMDFLLFFLEFVVLLFQGW